MRCLDLQRGKQTIGQIWLWIDESGLDVRIRECCDSHVTVHHSYASRHTERNRAKGYDRNVKTRQAQARGGVSTHVSDGRTTGQEHMEEKTKGKNDQKNWAVFTSVDGQVTNKQMRKYTATLVFTKDDFKKDLFGNLKVWVMKRSSIHWLNPFVWPHWPGRGLAEMRNQEFHLACE